MNNNNRIDLYRWLLEKIQEEDQLSGAQGHTFHWDDPDMVWDSGNPDMVWDNIGLSPVIQNLFWVVEKMAEEDLEMIENLDAIIDPLRCPESFLPHISAALGYRLDESGDEQLKRAAVLGLMRALKARGTNAGINIFYRLIGVNLVDVFPLWKKMIHEENEDYSRVRYLTSAVNEVLGTGSAFAGKVGNPPIKPGSVSLSYAGTVFGRDEVVVEPQTKEDVSGRGVLVGSSIVGGTVNYATGQYTLALAAPAPTQVHLGYETVDEEWPYRAARIDMEILLAPAGTSVPLITTEYVNELLRRLEETRPIHVLLRSFALCIELEEDPGPGACDTQGPVQIAISKIEEPGIPAPATPIHLPYPTGIDPTTKIWVLDGACFGDMPGEDDLTIEAGTLAVKPLEDMLTFVCPYDTLQIDAGGSISYV